MSKILEIAELIEFLTSDVTLERKVSQIKLDIVNGIITESDGLDLVVAYIH